jgi:hypothetical protein
LRVTAAPAKKKLNIEKNRKPEDYCMIFLPIRQKKRIFLFLFGRN